MPRFQAPRGTRDLLPPERSVFLRLEGAARDLATRYGYQPIETPMFEQAAVYERGVGEVTDVVEKELFRVQAGRGDEERERWALRPEPTAGIVRAYVQHGMRTWAQPVKLTLTGPMFRYDRPQAGRYRQFWQFDVEVIGDPGPAVDAEIIELATAFFATVGLEDVQVLVNSIGDAACRPAYIASLRDYFRAREAELPDLERTRLATNPLRLLDSKDGRMAPLIASAPTISQHLCEACRDHFDGLLAHLEALSIEPRLAPTLVRGLDYYTRTAFEFYRPGAEGQQQALGGGGRYDGLVELLGGQPTPGIGFGIGLDRVALALAEQTAALSPEPWRPAAVVVGADAQDTVVRLQVATELRGAGLACWPDLTTRRLGKQLEGAGRAGAHFAVICGDELEEGHVQLRDLEAGTQRQVAVPDLARELLRAQAQHRHGGDG
jgi:histidyl-tRNA synthetase